MLITQQHTKASVSKSYQAFLYPPKPFTQRLDKGRGKREMLMKLVTSHFHQDIDRGGLDV